MSGNTFETGRHDAQRVTNGARRWSFCIGGHRVCGVCRALITLMGLPGTVPASREARLECRDASGGLLGVCSVGSAAASGKPTALTRSLGFVVGTNTRLNEDNHMSFCQICSSVHESTNNCLRPWTSPDRRGEHDEVRGRH